MAPTCTTCSSCAGWSSTSTERPLTRIDAQRRAAAIRVGGYELGLDLRGPGDTFASRSRVTFRVLDATEPLWVDVRPDVLHTATLDGRPLDLGTAWQPDDGRLGISAAPGEHELVVDTTMRYSSDGEGLHRHVDPVDGRTYLYAMSFLDAAPRWFACFDQPDLKAPVAAEVRCPGDWTVAGNGPVTALGPGRWRIAPTGPLATYVVTLVAGPYHQVRGEHDGIPLVLHARRSLAEHLDREAPQLFAHTARCFDELHRLFGVRYPWGEYHQAFVPDFNAGAMENPGCVTLRDQFVFRSRASDAERADRDRTVAHEMAHMWFGDLVTMRWWDDLWLNESFAEYLGHRVCGADSWPAFGIERKAWGYDADRRPSTHPVAGNDASDAAQALNAFDGISYAKGAAVLRQLAARLGDDVFLAGLRGYITRHADGNATLADLLAAWTAAGAVDLDTWATSWLRTSGFDTLAVRDGQIVRTVTHGAARPHRIAVARFDADGRERERRPVTVDADTVTLPVSDQGVVLLDPADETWARVEPADWPALLAALPGIADPAARVVVWNAVRLAVADAGLDPRLALDVVHRAVGREPDAVLDRIPAWAARAAATCLPDGEQDAASAALLRTGLEALGAAEPGSGRQLTAARLVLRTQADPAAIRSWLDGDDVPAGLVLDAELRWVAVSRLAGLGALRPGELAAEQDRDPSSAGAVHAAYCRAALPDPAAKAAAWSRITTDGGLGNYELYALAGGFWQPGQAALTGPYVQRYFAEIRGAAALRTGWAVRRLATALYPWTVVSAPTLAATDALLAAPGLDPGVRRAVVDAGDDLRRALAVRTRFPGPSPTP